MDNLQQILKQEREMGSISARVDIVEKQVISNKIEVEKRLTNIEDTMNKEFEKINDLVKKGDDEIKESLEEMVEKLNHIDDAKKTSSGFISGVRWIVAIIFSFAIAAFGVISKFFN